MSTDLFHGDMPLVGLTLLREQAVDEYESAGALAGYTQMAIVADLALARVEALERTVRDTQKILARDGKRAGLGPDPSARAARQERRVRAELHPRSGCVENVVPFKPKDAA